MPGKDLFLRLQPEKDIGRTIGNDLAGELIRPAGDLPLEIREFIALDGGNGRGFCEVGHARDMTNTVLPGCLLTCVHRVKSYSLTPLADDGPEQASRAARS